MKEERDIYSEVNKTMQALDKLEPAQTDRFFFFRLQSKLEQREQAVAGDFRLSWVAAVTLIILINVFSVLYYTGGERETGEINQEQITAFADEYALTPPTVYEQNSNEQ